MLHRDQIIAERYRVVEGLGQGRLGSAYAAEVLQSGERVLLKEIYLPSGVDPGSLFHHFQELLALAHPRLVPLCDALQVGDKPVLVSAFMEGGSLSGVISDEPLSGEMASEIVSAIAEGLAVLHERGLVHGDLKPSNIFIDADGELRLSDYGMPQLLSPRPPLEQAIYTAPEVWSEGAHGVAADMFALGAVAYQLAAGVAPFRGATLDELRQAVLQREAVPVRHVEESIPPQLAELITDLLLKNPGKRLLSAERAVRRLQPRVDAEEGGDYLASAAVLQGGDTAEPGHETPGQGKPLPEPEPAVRPRPQSRAEREAVFEEQPLLAAPGRRLPFAFLTSFLGALIVYLLGSPLLNFWWRLTGGTEQQASWAGALWLAAFTAIVCAAPYFCLAWTFRPTLAALRYYLAAAGILAALLLLIVSINFARLAAAAPADALTAENMSARTPQTLRLSLHTAVQTALLVPRGTLYRAAVDSSFPEFFLGSKNSPAALPLYVAALLVNLALLGAVLALLRGEASLKLWMWRIAAVLLVLGLEAGAVPPLARMAGWNALREHALPFGPFSIQFEEHMILLAALNWLLVLVWMIGPVRDDA